MICSARMVHVGPDGDYARALPLPSRPRQPTGPRHVEDLYRTAQQSPALPGTIIAARPGGVINKPPLTLSTSAFSCAPMRHVPHNVRLAVYPAPAREHGRIQ